MIDHNFTLKAIAYKTGFIPSQVVTYNYTTGNVPHNWILSFTLQGVDGQAKESLHGRGAPIFRVYARRRETKGGLQLRTSRCPVRFKET